MTSVSDFLLENVESPVKKEEVKFDRFKSPFVIKTLMAEDVSDLRKQATRNVLNKKTRLHEQVFDQDKFTDLVLTASIVNPPLNNAELQKSYGCIADPEGLLKHMLNAGEYNELAKKVMEISGLNDDNSNDLVEEAKN